MPVCQLLTNNNRTHLLHPPPLSPCLILLARGSTILQVVCNNTNRNKKKLIITQLHKHTHLHTHFVLLTQTSNKNGPQKICKNCSNFTYTTKKPTATTTKLQGRSNKHNTALALSAFYVQVSVSLWLIFCLCWSLHDRGSASQTGRQACAPLRFSYVVFIIMFYFSLVLLFFAWNCCGLG